MKVEVKLKKCSFYVGQNVWCLKNGWTKVKTINDTGSVVTETGLYFLFDGRHHISDNHPSLFHRDILNNTKPPCGFRSGDIVMVANCDKPSFFLPVIFQEQVENKYKCLRGSLNSPDIYFWEYCISIEEYHKRLQEQK